MKKHHPFHDELKEQFHSHMKLAQSTIPENEILRVDLHCHDYNSDVTDELWGRILRLPETWLTTKDLVKNLRKSGTNITTITNHNNARSCWDLLDKGEDVLVGAEFTCHFPDNPISFHVLTYGFTPDQEERLKSLRHNLYHFMAYTAAENIPTVLPHPLYFYSSGKTPDLDLFEKMALMFERFEVLNGQRNIWQNLLTWDWIHSITPDKLEMWSKKHGIAPGEFCRNPYDKRVTGGTDDHMGHFAGTCGTLLHVPNLKERAKVSLPSELALEAIRTGRMAPYGYTENGDKLNIAFLDYFAQVATHMKDPGLFRMFLHKGELKDKMFCLAIANGMMELGRHRYTMSFLKSMNQAFQGKRPSFLLHWTVSKDYKTAVKQMDRIAQARNQGPKEFVEEFQSAFTSLFTHLNQLICNRLRKQLTNHPLTNGDSFYPAQFLKKLEIPSHLRTLFSPDKKGNSSDMASLNLPGILDQVSFPLLAAGLIGGSVFATSKVLNNSRTFLNSFAKKLGRPTPPEKALWLTDSFTDSNGVSTALKALLQQVQEHDLPIDLLSCHSEEATSEDNLHLFKSITELSIPGYPQQKLQLPDLLQVQKQFEKGGYDRIVCSTELLMGPIALYLKAAYQVPAYFFMHTDWLEYFKKSWNSEAHLLDRIRRVLRAFYREFDGIFVLNSEHKEWLISADMGIPEEKVHLTAHWVSPPFYHSSFSTLSKKVSQAPRLMYAGRLSPEKGVSLFPKIDSALRKVFPELTWVIAGEGPSRKELEKKLPSSTFLGWVSSVQLSQLYTEVDLLVFPSQFDTFGCAVLESMACGLPVIAYDTKGPRDIIEHNVSGFLVDEEQDFIPTIQTFLEDTEKQEKMSQEAYRRSLAYQPKTILEKLLKDLKFSPNHSQDTQRVNPVPEEQYSFSNT